MRFVLFLFFTPSNSFFELNSVTNCSEWLRPFRPINQLSLLSCLCLRYFPLRNCSLMFQVDFSSRCRRFCSAPDALSTNACVCFSVVSLPSSIRVSVSVSVAVSVSLLVRLLQFHFRSFFHLDAKSDLTIYLNGFTWLSVCLCLCIYLSLSLSHLIVTLLSLDICHWGCELRSF